MTRIIAGTARGRRLKVPPANTRPTSDRVREAVFSSLESHGVIRGASVLDLFAGSGALGLEAISRRARKAVLVDQSAAAVRVMQVNVGTVGLPGCQVVKQSVAGFLRGAPTPFDLVFIDPPYELPPAQVNEVLTDLTGGWLAPLAHVVVERGRDGAQIAWPTGMAQDWQRRFGDTHVLRAVWYGHGQSP